MTTKKDLSIYETPQVEIIEVEVEKGFIGSGDSDGNNDGTGTGDNFGGGWG